MAGKKGESDASAGKLVWAAMVAPSGVALGFVSIALSLVTIFVTPNVDFPLQWSLAMAFIVAAYITLCHSVIRGLIVERDELERALQNATVRTPKVLRAIKNPLNDVETILLVEGNSLFGTSMLVSIYHENSEAFEMLVATGVVQSAQSNGFLQISVADWLSPFDDLRDNVRAGREDVLERLIIRPSATTNFVSQRAPDLNEAIAVLLERATQTSFIENGSNDDE